MVSDAPVWQCLLKNGVKGIYSCLVRSSDIPKSLNKWSKELNTEIDVKEIFDIIFKTTNDSCLSWFQYKLLYRLTTLHIVLFVTMQMKLYYTCFGTVQK